MHRLYYLIRCGETFATRDRAEAIRVAILWFCQGSFETEWAIVEVAP